MKRALLSAIGFWLLAIGCQAQWGAPADPNAGKGMKDMYKDYFMIGVALNQRNVSNQDQINLVKAEFNSITAENDMKPGELHPKEGVWNWEKADKIARYFQGKAKVAFGIGTYLSNDTYAEPLNIVMKVTKCNGQDVAKISDAPGKGMCKSQEYVDYLQRAIDWRLKHNN